MSDTFRAVVVDKVDNQHSAGLRDLTLGDLPEHDVLVDVEYSTLNYKDGLAITGAAPICRSVPMVCGVDLAGTVAESASDSFSPGDRVLVNGYGLSESHWGGYSQKARLKSDWLRPGAGRFHEPAGDGDRHRRVHGDAVRDGAAGSRREHRREATSWSRARREAWVPWRWRCWRVPATA